MLLNKGRHRGERILSRPAVELMMTDQLTPAQKQGTELFFGDSASWGLGGAVVTRRTHLWATPGRYGWDGGYGSSAHLDPAEDMPSFSPSKKYWRISGRIASKMKRRWAAIG